MGAAPADEPTSSRVVVARRLDDAARLNVHALLATAAQRDGFWPLSDQLASDLAEPSADETRRPVAVLLEDADGRLSAYAQASRRDEGWTMQIAVGDTPPDVTERIVSTLIEAVLDALHAEGGGTIDWWIYQPTDNVGDIAEANGFSFDRDLLQMRRALPADRRAAVPTRSFVPSRDEEAWVAVNNRAFSGHPEQGRWTIDTLHQRMTQPWFDPDGFRLHERDGRLAAFCWTKVHDEMSAPHDTAANGEIYVIGVDPEFQGVGLGKELTLAGLDHLSDHGIKHALLYVAGSNTAARGMYERLGFHVSRIDRAYSRGA